MHDDKRGKKSKEKKPINTFLTYFRTYFEVMVEQTSVKAGYSVDTDRLQRRSQGGPEVPVTSLLQAFFNQIT